MLGARLAGWRHGGSRRRHGPDPPPLARPPEPRGHRVAGPRGRRGPAPHQGPRSPPGPAFRLARAAPTSTCIVRPGHVDAARGRPWPGTAGSVGRPSTPAPRSTTPRNWFHGNWGYVDIHALWPGPKVHSRAGVRRVRGRRPDPGDRARPLPGPQPHRPDPDPGPARGPHSRQRPATSPSPGTAPRGRGARRGARDGPRGCAPRPRWPPGSASSTRSSGTGPPTCGATTPGAGPGSTSGGRGCGPRPPAARPFRVVARRDHGQPRPPADGAWSATHHPRGRRPASCTGCACSGASWPASPATRLRPRRPHRPVVTTETFKVADNVAWLDLTEDGEVVYATTLPDGPPIVLRGQRRADLHRGDRRRHPRRRSSSSGWATRPRRWTPTPSATTSTSFVEELVFARAAGSALTAARRPGGRMTRVPNPPQLYPLPRELDDLELLISGALRAGQPLRRTRLRRHADPSRRAGRRGRCSSSSTPRACRWPGSPPTGRSSRSPLPSTGRSAAST